MATDHQGVPAVLCLCRLLRAEQTGPNGRSILMFLYRRTNHSRLHLWRIIDKVVVCAQWIPTGTRMWFAEISGSAR